MEHDHRLACRSWSVFQRWAGKGDAELVEQEAPIESLHGDLLASRSPWRLSIGASCPTNSASPLPAHRWNTDQLRHANRWSCSIKISHAERSEASRPTN